MARVARSKPCWASCCSTMSRIENSSPIGTSGLGSRVVYGRRRTPWPRARITACMVASSLKFEGGSAGVVARPVPGEVRRVAEPGDGLLQTGVAGVPGSPAGAVTQPRGVAAQPHDLGVLGTQPLDVLHDLDVGAHEAGDVVGEPADRHLVAGARVEPLAHHGGRGGLA